MPFAPIRDAFIKLLEKVDGIGQVHNRVRHEVFWDEFIKTANKNGRLNTWEVGRRELVQTIAAVGDAESNTPTFQDNHTLLLVGRMALNDKGESEVIFQALIDAITDAQRKDDRLGGAYLQPAFMQTELIEHRSFGGVLVHYCEMTLMARRREIA